MVKRLFFVALLILGLSSYLSARQFYIEGVYVYFDLLMDYKLSSSLNDFIVSQGYEEASPLLSRLDYGASFFSKSLVFSESFTLMSFANPISQSGNNQLLNLYGGKTGINRTGFLGSINFLFGYNLFQTPNLIFTLSAGPLFEWGYLFVGPESPTNIDLDTAFSSADSTSRIRRLDLSLEVSGKLMLSANTLHGTNDQGWFRYSEYHDTGFFMQFGYILTPLRGLKNVSASGNADISELPSAFEHRVYLGLGVTLNMDLELRRFDD